MSFAKSNPIDIVSDIYFTPTGSHSLASQVSCGVCSKFYLDPHRLRICPWCGNAAMKKGEIMTSRSNMLRPFLESILRHLRIEMDEHLPGSTQDSVKSRIEKLKDAKDHLELLTETCEDNPGRHTKLFLSDMYGVICKLLVLSIEAMAPYSNNYMVDSAPPFVNTNAVSVYLKDDRMIIIPHPRYLLYLSKTLFRENNDRSLFNCLVEDIESDMLLLESSGKHGDEMFFATTITYPPLKHASNPNVSYLSALYSTGRIELFKENI